MRKFLCVTLFLLFVTCAWAQEPETLVQVSTIDALLKGDYDGKLALKDLRPYGDFGLGTFDHLNGVFYQVTSEGVVHKAGGEVTTPFAAVTFFESDMAFPLKAGMNYRQLARTLEEMIPDKNVFYAVRVKGKFPDLTVRSVPPQQKPYPPLEDVVSHGQKVFHLKDARGTLVGFWCPSRAKGLNATGLHLHFLSWDKSAGGHVLDFTSAQGVVQVDETEALRVLSSQL